MVKTDIGNLALQHLGVSKPIANIDTETSLEARSLRSVFDGERDACLRDFPWPFATAYGTLALVSGSSTSPANGDWVFSYRVPVDCIFARRIVQPGLSGLSGTPGSCRRRARIPLIPFRRGRDNQGGLIYTSQDQAVLEYTVQITNAADFDPLFATALAWRLAITCAPALSRVDGITKTCQAGYELEKSRAEAQALNESQADEAADAEWISGR